MDWCIQFCLISVNISWYQLVVLSSLELFEALQSMPPCTFSLLLLHLLPWRCTKTSTKTYTCDSFSYGCSFLNLTQFFRQHNNWFASLRSMAVLSGAQLSGEAARKIKTASPDSWPFQLPPTSTHLDNPVDNLFGFSFPSQSEIKFWQAKRNSKARDIM